MTNDESYRMMEARMRLIEVKGVSDREKVVTLLRKFAEDDARPDHVRLRAFENAKDAYSVGMWFKAKSGDVEAKRWCQDHGVEARAQGSTGSTTGADSGSNFVS